MKLKLKKLHWVLVLCFLGNVSHSAPKNTDGIKNTPRRTKLVLEKDFQVVAHKSSFYFGKENPSEQCVLSTPDYSTEHLLKKGMPLVIQSLLVVPNAGITFVLSWPADWKVNCPNADLKVGTFKEYFKGFFHIEWPPPIEIEDSFLTLKKSPNSLVPQNGTTH